MCTAMLYDPKDHYKPEETKKYFEENVKGFERLLRFKRWKLLKPFLKKEGIMEVVKTQIIITLFFPFINLVNTA